MEAPSGSKACCYKYIEGHVRLGFLKNVFCDATQETSKKA